MKVKLIQTWRGYKPGIILDLAEGAANELLRRGRAVVVDVPAGPVCQAEPVAAERRETETASIKPGRRVRLSHA